MKLVIDDKIPYIREAIAHICNNVVYLKGSEISSKDVQDADALIVRTRTRCDEKLLHKSKVSFVATATAGYDHLDVDYLNRSQIKWISCPGCNSSSVAQYVNSVLLLLKKKGKDLSKLTLGVVGFGHVGSKVAQKALLLGMKVLVTDPPLKQAGVEGNFVDIEEIQNYADIITFHVPLNREAPHATLYMVNKEFFSNLKKCPIIINTSRGGIVDEKELILAIKNKKVHDVVIDTWMEEPNINLELLDLSWIATPHIAGYSADGKVNANNMVLKGLCEHFGIKDIPHLEPPQLPLDFTISKDEDILCLQLYNPEKDSLKLHNAPQDFEKFRNEYPLRREHLF